MRTRSGLPAVVGLCVVAATVAQPPAPPKPDRVPEFEVLMADGSTVMMTVSDPTATIQTKYGPLAVPVREVLKAELGFRYPDGVEEKVNAAAAELGSPSFAAREAADRALLRHMEYAVPAVRRATKHSDPEVARRAESLLARLTKAVPADRMPGREFDTIETAEFTVKGRLTNPTLKARTRYFGETVLHLSEVRQLTAVAASGSEIGLNAAEFAKPGQPNWFDTKIDVADGRPLTIVCTGQIDQWPQEPGRYMVGANGSRFAPGNGMVLPPGGMRGQGMISSPGAVIGRFGTNGNPFFVGASYKVPKAAGGGRLYLQIQPSQWGGDSAGSYKVRVTADE